MINTVITATHSREQLSCLSW